MRDDAVGIDGLEGRRDPPLASIFTRSHVTNETVVRRPAPSTVGALVNVIDMVYLTMTNGVPSGDPSPIDSEQGPVPRVRVCTS
jgi:hypothetical protein